MSALLLSSALFTGFVAISRFVLGQLLFGQFSLAATFAGLGGNFCAAFALKMSSQPTWAPARLYLACVIALLGVAMEVAIHYLHFDIQGNCCAWHIVGPYIVSIVLIACVASRRRASGRTDE